MSDVTDLGPLIELAKLRRKDKKEYDSLMEQVELVTRDMIGISMKLANEQRKKMEKMVN